MLQHIKTILLFSLLSLVTSEVVQSSVHKEFVGEQIESMIKTGSHFLIENSDSLYLNGKLLERGKDYIFNSKLQQFELFIDSTDVDDTLIIKYFPMPSWIKTSYGEKLPEIKPGNKNVTHQIHSVDDLSKKQSRSSVDLSGSKSFRFSQGGVGVSQFNQTLDLSIKGNLTPELSIKGTISDRGYDPSYGTANSRLNELDKVHLLLSSSRFRAQVGDILIDNRGKFQPLSQKKISGIDISLRYDNVYIGATAARPKGTYLSTAFKGIDGQQGPYQISVNNKAEPIVPGSETVWLDGQQLSRGANQDYTFDYPIGRITFNVNRPIDSRSRIEIDYEPQTTEYKKEFFKTENRYQFYDSAIVFNFGWIREGDDQNENLSELFSDADKDILETFGDGTAQPYRSSVQVDSLGAYVLATDSLPDSVYHYVGAGNGDYSIRFSFVGANQGEYVYIGGENYQYVGVEMGDYLPVVVLTAPERTDYLMSSIQFRGEQIGEFGFQLHQSRYDKNLYSTLDDENNNGTYYRFNYERKWDGEKNRFGVSHQQTDNNFKTRTRLNSSDHSYRFLLPHNRQFTTGEQLSEITLLCSPLKSIVIKPAVEFLSYKNQFESLRGNLAVTYIPIKKLTMNGEYNNLSTEYDSLSIRKGEAQKYQSRLSYQLTKGIQLSTEYEHNVRQNNYDMVNKGTKFNRYLYAVQTNNERVSFERFLEDSLTGNWSQYFQRSRFGVRSERIFGDFRYRTTINYQLLKRLSLEEESFLSRLNFSYANHRKNIHFNSSYALSEETRNSRGITYIEVKEGEGDYIFEDSQYIADANGNFILVEEILSEQSKVSRGDKGFSFSKNWNLLQVRLTSTIEEELLEGQSRNLIWTIPFYSDENKSYLFYNRRYYANIKLFPISGGHFMNLNLSNNRQSRRILENDRIREDFEIDLILKQTSKNLFFEEQIKSFDNARDSYYSGSGNIHGYALSSKISRLSGVNRVGLKFIYRYANADNDEKSKIYSILATLRYQPLKRSEVRSSIELYQANGDEQMSTSSYLLTGNRPGKKGAVWSLSVRYGLKKDLQLNLSVNGRHSDNKTARVYARSEFIARF